MVLSTCVFMLQTAATIVKTVETVETVTTPIIVDAVPGALEAALERVADYSRSSTAVLWLRGGEHQLSATLRLSAHHSRLVLASHPGEHAIISGGVRVPPSSWQPEPAAGLVSASLAGLLPAGVTPRQMWTSNGVRRATRARHPNLFAADGTSIIEAPYLRWASTLCNTKVNKSDACAAVNRFGLRYNASDDALLKALLPLAPELNAVVYHGWTASRHCVASLDPSSRTLRFSNPSDRPIGFWSGVRSEGGQRYYLENALPLLDSPGEWFYEASQQRLFYRPLPGEAEQNGSAYLPVLDELLCVDGASDVSFDGVSFRHVDWLCGGTDGTQQCDGQSVAWQETAAVHLVNSTRVRFTGCEVAHVGPAALWVDDGSEDVLIERSNLSDLGTGAVRIGPARPGPLVRRVSLRDSTLSEGGWVFPGGTAVLVQFAEAVTIEHNEICNFSYTAISLGWSWNYAPQPGGGHVVAHNHIHHLGFPRRETGDAMACVYTLGRLEATDGSPTNVTDNVCHDVRAYMSGGYCLSQDQGSSHLRFERNVCLRTTGSPHNTHYGFDVSYKNNIFYDGYHDAWTLPNAKDGSAAGALRTSPMRHSDAKHVAGCHGEAVGYNGSCPDRLRFSCNLVGQPPNQTAFLFEGDWVGNGSAPIAFDFDANLYWSDAKVDLSAAAVFGGVTGRVSPHPKQLTWSEWRATGQDSRSALGAPRFADASWAQPPFNVTLMADSPAWELGCWQHIDTTGVGPRGLGK